MARAATIGGSSGAGKGEISGALYVELAKELGDGDKGVKSFDQGATFRAATHEAIVAGATTGKEVVRHALNMIEHDSPDAFLERFHRLWDNPDERQKLRSQQVSGLVASIGWEDSAQHFFTDLLNRRVQVALALGARAIVVDSRTPEILLQPTFEQELLELYASVYMNTPADVAAHWAALKPSATKTEEELHADLVKRNHDDSTRRVFPNFEPDSNARTEITKANVRDIKEQIIAGRLSLPESRLYIVNNGPLSKEDLHSFGRCIARSILAGL